MTYKSKTDFIRNHNVRKLGIVEYCLGLEKQGLTEEQIQAKMIVDKVSRTPRATQMNFSKYKNISKQIGWIK